MQITLHCLGMCHAVTSKRDDMMTEAYTQTLVNFSKGMFPNPDFKLVHYGNEDSELDCHEHVTVTTRKDLEIAYKNYDRTKETHREKVNDHAHKTFYANASRELCERVNHGDFILPFWGMGHLGMMHDIAHLPAHIVEPSIGYDKTFANFRVYVSESRMNGDYGRNHQSKKLHDQAMGYFNGIEDWNIKAVDCNQSKVFEWKEILQEIKNGLEVCQNMANHNYDEGIPRWCDDVIPVPIDEEDFDYTEDNDGYYFFMGRMNYDKGLDLAIRLAKEMGRKLIVAGQGEPEKILGYKLPPHVEFLGGSIGLEKRRECYSRALLVIMPTLYSEPFGMIVPEAGASGKPILTTDWGAFRETVQNGVNGYRSRSFPEFVDNAKKIEEGLIESQNCRDWAMQYSLKNAAIKYDKYFKRVSHFLNSGNEFNDNCYDSLRNKNFWSIKLPDYSINQETENVKSNGNP